MKLLLAAAALAAATLPSLAAAPVRQMIYNVDAPRPSVRPPPTTAPNCARA